MNSRLIGALLLVVGVGAALAVGLLTRDAPPELPAGESPDFGTWTATGNLERREVAMMGTSVVFVVEGEPAAARTAIAAAEQRLRELEETISEWKPGSEISRLNGRAGLAPVKVGPDSMALLKLAKQFAAETDGAFDVTIGPVWDLWPFRNRERALPTDAELAQALKLVGCTRLELDEAAGTARLPTPGMRVNLGAIGKGYAARLACEVIRSHGFTHVAVSAGGDLCLAGRKQTGPWIVGIEHPLYPGQYIERFAAGDGGVATSGNAQRFVIRDGKRYGHILDPRTGQPVSHCLSVTVVCADAAAADAYATAVFVMGPDKGMAWVEAREGVEALIVDADSGVQRSSGWSRVAHSVAAAQQSKPPDENPVTPATPSRTTPVTGLGVLAGRVVLGETVLVPSGPYLLGDERVATELPAYRMDKFEVTNRQYAAFLEAIREDPAEFDHPAQPRGKDHTPRYWTEFRPPLFRQSGAAALAPFDEKTFRDPDRPVVGVDWWDACAYARWAGKRLPTAQEWQAAARGTDGRLWPWGNEWDYARANTGGEKWGEKDGHIYAAPASAFLNGASPWGCLNMAGNVAEWTQEGFVVGGSSNSNPTHARCAARELREPEYRSFDIGFRCVAEAP